MTSLIDLVILKYLLCQIVSKIILDKENKRTNLVFMCKTDQSRRIQELLELISSQGTRPEELHKLGPDEWQKLVETFYPEASNAASKQRHEDMQLLMQTYAPLQEGDDPRSKKQQRIVKAATALFVKNGYRKTSVDEIARRAHLAKGTIYLYFKTKADILLQAIVEEKTRFTARLNPVVHAEIQPREKLQLLLRAIFQGLAEMPLVSRLLGGDREIMFVLEEMNATVQIQAFDLQAGFLSELIDHAARPHRWTQEEIEDRGKVLTGMMYAAGSFQDERIRGGLSYDRFAGILADVLATGLSSSAEPMVEKKK